MHSIGDKLLYVSDILDWIFVVAELILKTVVSTFVYLNQCKPIILKIARVKHSTKTLILIPVNYK